MTEVLAWATFLVGVPLCAVTTFFLRKASREKPYLRYLRERYLVSIGAVVIVLFFSLIFINNDQAVPPLSLDTTKIITRLAMFGFAVVTSAGFIWLYKGRGKKRGG